MDLHESEQQQMDVFDLLPDALVLEIFNRVEDAKSLSACMILCKRFENLVPQTYNVSLEITRRSKLPELSKEESGLHTEKSKGFISTLIFKPIHAWFHRLISRKLKTCSCSEDEEDDSFKLPNDLIKNFNEIRSLSVKLPGHDRDLSSENGSGAFLKWKAEFGRELESCVILGATGLQRSEIKPINVDEKESGKDGEISPAVSSPSNMTNKQLKKRVVWTISCLIASSARHHILKQIVSMNRMIRDVKISDGSKQGTICMTERQVAELRKEMNSTAEPVAVEEIERTKIPSVMIKMWYVSELELPESGCVMKGATLAVIRPVATAVDKADDVSLAMGSFGEKCMEEAVRKLIEKKNSYTLEMNSF